jgi:hypothetical protein
LFSVLFEIVSSFSELQLFEPKYSFQNDDPIVSLLSKAGGMLSQFSELDISDWILFMNSWRQSPNRHEFFKSIWIHVLGQLCEKTIAHKATVEFPTHTDLVESMMEKTQKDPFFIGSVSSYLRKNKKEQNEYIENSQHTFKTVRDKFSDAFKWDIN